MNRVRERAVGREGRSERGWVMGVGWVGGGWVRGGWEEGLGVARGEN
jgi:hypothetical protein